MEEIDGFFKINSGSLYVGDPCYGPEDPQPMYKNVLNNVRKGVWYFHIEKENGITKSLYAHHCVTAEKGTELTFDNVEDVAVDAGLMSIFDLETYKTLYDSWFDGKGGQDGWDKGIVEGLSNADYFSYPNGIISSSGYGDGIYACIVGKDNKGNIALVEVPFLVEDDEDDFKHMLFTEHS